MLCAPSHIPAALRPNTTPQSRRLGGWFCAALTTAAILASDSAHASEGVREVFDICSELGIDPDIAHQRLLKAGWSAADSPETTFETVFWTVFARDFISLDDDALAMMANSEVQGQQLGYLISNANFMAASILGNSALPANQPSYHKDGFALSTLGISLGKGYCILTGPADSFDALARLDGFVESWPEGFPKSGRDGAVALSGETDAMRALAVALDDAAIKALFNSTPISLMYSQREFEPSMLDNMPAVVVHISPKRPQ